MKLSIIKWFRVKPTLFLEKEMATHSSILAWKIPWTEEPGGLQSMGSRRVGHDGDFHFTHHPFLGVKRPNITQTQQ